MAILIAAAANGVLLGYMLGLLYSSRHTDRNAEIAYLTGHVDGYTKAEHDLIVADWKESK
jgi:hypothetical protein